MNLVEILLFSAGICVNREELKDDPYCNIPTIRHLLSLTANSIKYVMSINNPAKKKNKGKAALLWCLMAEWLEEAGAMANTDNFGIPERKQFLEYHQIREDFDPMIKEINRLRKICREGMTNRQTDR